ncbi:MAG TPA: hypothetical protein DCW68_05120 [Rhodospirillaceae bacterium]|nr:MAG: hypothetical protein A2018_02525 [Alphaproteobacteria bacterium GWF2_58_20]HAU29477.1 hypothetical protein [Rhodospirillaceae bacterium]
MRSILIVLSLVLFASTVHAAESARMEHVFRRRIEICLAWGGCDEDGGTVPVAGAPVISPISDQRIARNAMAGPVAFAISDTDTAPDSISVSVTADDGTLLPASGISRSCVTGSCTMSLSPAFNEIGQTSVTVSASDGSHVTSRVFLLRVLDATAPYIGSIADQTGPVNLPMGPIGFVVDDFDSDPATLSLNAVSGDDALVDSGDISFGGVGASRTMILQPQLGARGVAQIVVSATDMDGNTGLRTFFVRIGTAPQISAIANQTTNAGTATSPIAFTVNDDGGADLVVVSAHSSDQAILPDAGIALSGSDENRSLMATPTTQTGVVTITLTASDGTEEAVTSFDLSVVEGGTAPWISAVSDQYTPIDTPIQVAFQIGDDDGVDPAHLAVYGYSTDTDLVPGITEWGDLDVVCDAAGSCLMDVEPAAGVEGYVTLWIYVDEQDDPYEWAERPFTLFILGDGPQISDIPPQATPMNTPLGPVAFSVADLPAPMSVHFSVTSSDEGIIAASSVSFGGSGMEWFLNLVPVMDASGDVDITVFAADDDGNEVSTTFPVRVFPVADCTPAISVADVEATPSCGEGWEEPVLAPIVVTDPCGGNPSMPYRSDWWDMPNGAYVQVSPTSIPQLFSDVSRSFAEDGEGNTDYDSPLVRMIPVDTGTGDGCWAGDADFTLTYDNGYGTATDSFHVRVNGYEFVDTEPPEMTDIGELDNNTVFMGKDTPVTRNFQVSDNVTSPENIVFYLDIIEADYFDLATGIVWDCPSSGNCEITLTPKTGVVGETDFRINAVDEAGNESYQYVRVSITEGGPNYPPVVVGSIPDQTIIALMPFSYTVDAGIFSDPEGQPLTYSIDVNPDWLYFTPSSMLLSGVPARSDVGTRYAYVMATDDAGQSETAPVRLTVLDNLPPTLSVLADTTTEAGVVTPEFVLTVGDDHTAADDLVLMATSDREDIVLSSSVAFGGSGTSRTISALPVATKSGMANITVAVMDGQGQTTTRNWVVNVTKPVGALDNPPSITDVPDATVASSATTTVAGISGVFEVDDDWTSRQDLAVQAFSANTGVLPNTNLVPIVEDLDPVGGKRRLRITVPVAASGSVSVNVRVIDNAAQTAEDPFILTMGGVASECSTPTITDIVTQTVYKNQPACQNPADMPLWKEYLVDVSDAVYAPQDITVLVSDADALIEEAKVEVVDANTRRVSIRSLDDGNIGNANFTVAATNTCGGINEKTFIQSYQMASGCPNPSDLWATSYTVPNIKYLRVDGFGGLGEYYLGEWYQSILFAPSFEDSVTHEGLPATISYDYLLDTDMSDDVINWRLAHDYLKITTSVCGDPHGVGAGISEGGSGRNRRFIASPVKLNRKLGWMDVCLRVEDASYKDAMGRPLVIEKTTKWGQTTAIAGSSGRRSFDVSSAAALWEDQTVNLRQNPPNQATFELPFNRDYKMGGIFVKQYVLPPSEPPTSVSITLKEVATGLEHGPFTLGRDPAWTPSNCTADCSQDVLDDLASCTSDCTFGYPTSCRADCPVTYQGDGKAPTCLSDCKPNIVEYSNPDVGYVFGIPCLTPTCNNNQDAWVEIHSSGQGNWAYFPENEGYGILVLNAWPMGGESNPPYSVTPNPVAPISPSVGDQMWVDEF